MRLNQVMATLAVLCIGGAAGAEDPRYQKGSPLKIDVEAGEGAAKVSTQVKANFKKPLTAAQFLDIEGRAMTFRESVQRKLAKLIDATPASDPDLPGLYHRLAESYGAEHRFYTFRRFEAEAKKRTKEARAYQQKAKKARRNAVKTFAALAKDRRFRNYKRMDEALYGFAHTLADAGKTKLASDIYKRLIQDYPQSNYVAYAFLYFGDRLFEDDELARAEVFYTKVLEFPKAEIYDYGMYKLGWVQAGRGNHRDALETFFKVTRQTAGKPEREELYRAARREFVRAYSEVGRPKTAKNAFRRIDGKHLNAMLAQLGHLYFDQGRAKKAVFILRGLIADNPKSARVCEWQHLVYQAVLSLGGKKRVAGEAIGLVKLYLAAKKKKLMTAPARAECADFASDVAERLAKVWHIEGAKTKDLEALSRAGEMYGAYLGAFGDKDNATQMQFHYGDLLWLTAELTPGRSSASKLWQRAADEFSKIARSKKGGSLRLDAAHAAVMAWKNALRVVPDVEPEATESEVAPEPRKISARQLAMLASFDDYIGLIKNPKHPELVMMKFLKARIYWRHDQLVKAVPLLREIVAEHPRHETARYSANILLNSLIRLERWTELAEASDKMLASAALLDNRDELRTRLTSIRLITLRRAAAKLEKAGEWIGCGNAYFEIAKNHADAEGIDEVLYNAGYCYERGKSLGFAVEMYRQLRSLFPRSVHARRALVRIGDAYAQIAKYKEAADAFETYARRYGGEELAAEAMSQAVAFRKGLGDDGAAIAGTRFYVRQYRKRAPRKTAAAMFSIHAIHLENGRDVDAIKSLREYIRRFGATGGRARLVAAHTKLGEIEWRLACRTPTADGSCVRMIRNRALRRLKPLPGRREVMPKRCGEADRLVVRVVKRNKRRAASARASFRRALELWSKGRDKGDSTKLAAFAAESAMSARFHLAEADYESYLAVEFPSGLDFDPSRPKVMNRSRVRFSKWLGSKRKQGEDLDKAYRAVLKGSSPHWAIAAAARMGQIPQSFADSLYRAEVPEFVRTGPYAEEGYHEYCGQLGDFASPLEKKSVAAFSFCLEESTKRNWFGRWARLCETELSAINRTQYPPGDEAHGAATNTAPVIDSAPLEVKLD